MQPKALEMSRQEGQPGAEAFFWMSQQEGQPGAGVLQAQGLFALASS